MDPQARLLLIGPAASALAGSLTTSNAVLASDPADALARLRSDPFTAVLCDPETLTRLLVDLRRDELVLNTIDKGVAILDPGGTIAWANPALRDLCPGEPVGQPLLDAFGAKTVASEDADPLADARGGRTVTIRLLRMAGPDRRYLDLTITPVLGAADAVTELVVLVRNVTAEVEQQRKLDALHQAGQDLAGLTPDQLDETNIPTRIELLKKNLRTSIRELFHFDTMEVRLLDRRTGELKPLLEDGMSPEAASRPLFAQLTGNGVTGYVAATGQSYLCPDTAKDPLYLEGATGARSSMTVPIKYLDEVVGTLNVESPRHNGFTPEDVQFTELFSKEIAAALHTLELLTAQQSCTAAQSVEAVNREIALPLDEVLGSAAMLLGRFRDDAETVGHLQRILAAARAVKENVLKVGRDLATADLAAAAPPLAGKRVLVVDADERSRRSAHLLLTRLGAAVEAAETATEGIALLTGQPFDTVLLDIKPPDMGGYEAYCRLRAARPEAKIAMTTGFGYDSAHSIVKARADGMQYVLFKPFRQDQLVTAVLDGSLLGRPVTNRTA